MSWELKGKPSTVKATAKLAKEFAEMEAAHVDRPLSERRLQVYGKIRGAGEFRPITWAKAWCKETGQHYRVNGKHTSTLFSDGQDLDGIYITVEEYDCDTLEDVAKLYATFDSGIASRTSTDINKSFASIIPELKDYGTRFINLVVSALNYKPTYGDGGHKSPPAERAEVLFDSIEIVMWLQGLLGDTNKPAAHIWRVPVVAAIAGSYHKSQKDALKFWTAVRDETGDKPDLPDRTLAKFLSTTVSDNGSRAGAPARFRISAREYFVKCIHAWNAWRTNDTTKMKYYVDAKLPAFK